MKNQIFSWLFENFLGKALLFSGLFTVGAAVYVFSQQTVVQLDGNIPNKALPNGNYSILLSFYDKPYQGNLLKQEEIKNVDIIDGKFETGYKTSLNKFKHI